MSNWKLFKGGVALAALAAASAVPAYAQVTTSEIRGVITTEAGSPISGASVIVTHEPTGTTSAVTTNSAGVYLARNLRVGGPYTVVVSGADIRTVEVTDVYVGLNETYDLSLPVSSERTLEAVVVTAPALAAGFMETGISSTFGLEELGRVVSIDRDIADAAQLDPFASINVQSGGGKELSIAGANNRFNSLTIDGIALNDRFGLNSNGYPTQRSPIPYDAIESLTVQTAPYDTQFNGFTGGTINAVTQSGTNEFHGSLSYYTTDDSMAGDRVGDTTVSREFDEESYAITLGGPIIEDKLFFFVAYDHFEESAAFRTGPTGTNAVNIIDILPSEVAEITQIASDVYGLDTGSFSGIDPVEDEKFLANIDWNINENHRARLTYMRTEGSSIAEQNGNNFVQGADVAYPSSWYNRSETVEAFIGHVYSDWTDNFSTELKIASTTQATGQDSLLGAETPQISIGGLGTDGQQVIAFGPDRYRHGNELDQEFMQYKALGTYLWGNHSFQFGFEREEVDADNLFAQNSEGTYAFATIDDFRNNIPSGLTYNNAVTNDENDLRAIWGYNQNSVYFQDTWDVLPTLTLMGGLRYDWYESEGTIRENQNFIDRYGYTNTTDLEGLDVIMPRFSFNWDAMENLTVRGGIGRFSGGAPAVWVSNSYSNDGVIADNVDYYSGDGGVNIYLPTSPDATTGQYIPPAVLAELAAGNPDGQVNALHPDFEIPSTWKANIGFAYNVDLGPSEDWTFSFDVLYNDYENAPYWFSPGCTPDGTAPDGRNTYECIDQYDIVVGSTDQGESLLYAVSVDKSFENGFDLFASYTHQDVEDVGMGTSSTATSNFSDSARYDYITPTAGTSNFQVEHLFKLRLNWEHEFVENFPTTVSMFATRRSGQPYSYTFYENNNCVFQGGGRCTIESAVDDAGHLLYVPSGPNDPLFSSDSFGGDAAAQQEFFDYINNSELSQYAGGIAERNGDNSRWSTIVDLRLEQEFPGVLDAHRTFFFLDIENLGNLINDDWGRIERTRYEYERSVVSAEIVNGQYVYDDLRTPSQIENSEILNQSLWQVQLGARYEF
ncbi:TonB-dependent receptor [Ponticaulis sp.]|uniref:TonB-dependent receptor n=1 Tax=Ponticaulis sp. TaxID=2020902 RepID=UPI000B64959C|nr:TonB-dependent receptor [Ponticaulis sp.]MAI89958.1 cell envelope biogenesis protein OmpA [Ponticaulis sp.]OUX99625.1 MAG: cell envelope biogenesis protein OmpA [Hyphomonadaceae bacterium TMED5]|tara:strand:- start:52768 stop:55959 length:3192 start_codon:yes stop_codon:yes gene_type:complete